LRSLHEDSPATVSVEFRAADAFTAIAIRQTVASGDVDTWRCSAFTELRAALGTPSFRPALGVGRTGVDAAPYSSELLEDELGEVVAFIPDRQPC